MPNTKEEITMKKIIMIIMLSLSAFALQGCVAAVIGVGAASTAKIASDPRTTGHQVDDAALDSKIGIKLKEETDFFKGSRIVPSAYNGDVLLIGQASAKQSKRAVEIAKNVEGIGKIYNQVRHIERISALTMGNDSKITLMVKTALVGNKETKARNIKVITENSEVFLIGIVTRNEGKLAADIASKVSGVKLVTTIFTYEN